MRTNSAVPPSSSTTKRPDRKSNPVSNDLAHLNRDAGLVYSWLLDRWGILMWDSAFCQLFHGGWQTITSYSRQGAWRCTKPGCRAQLAYDRRISEARRTHVRPQAPPGQSALADAHAIVVAPGPRRRHRGKALVDYGLVIALASVLAVVGLIIYRPAVSRLLSRPWATIH